MTHPQLAAPATFGQSLLAPPVLHRDSASSNRLARLQPTFITNTSLCLLDDHNPASSASMNVAPTALSCISGKDDVIAVQYSSHGQSTFMMSHMSGYFYGQGEFIRPPPVSMDPGIGESCEVTLLPGWDCVNLCCQAVLVVH